MSMLQKILHDMYIEPELLNELDEEQKQILFCKMREEQLRRWAIREKELEEQEKLCPKSSSDKNASRRRVHWMLGGDGAPWTWVMGEHENDKTIEEIIEREAQERAWKLAEREAEELRLQQEEALKEKLRTQGLDQDENTTLTTPSTPHSSHQGACINHGVDAAEEPEVEQKSVRFHVPEVADYKSVDENATTNCVPSVNGEEKELSENSGAINFSNTAVAAENDEDVHALFEKLKQAKLTVAQHGIADSPQFQTFQYQSSDSDIVKEREALELKLRVEAERRIEEEKRRRQSEIYQSLKEARERTNQEAEQEELEEQRYWEEQEKKSREAEEQIRNIARNAREQHRKHELRTSSSILSVLNQINNTTEAGTPHQM